MGCPEGAMEKASSDFRFIDLFAGIGGIRIALEEAGGTCVLTSEIDKFARQTYRAYFQDQNHLFNEDLTTLAPVEIPDHDVLAGGFPCQPFSIAGVSKKNSLGRAHGFEDPTKGTLFFNIKEILRVKRPKAFLLENVKNLKSHDKGRTWKIIASALHDEGYVFSDRVLDAAAIVPQHRERVFIVGFDREFAGVADRTLDWTPFWNEVEAEIATRRDVERERYGLEPNDEWPVVDHVLEPHETVDDRYTLTPRLWEYLQEYRRKHRARGNGFGYGLVEPGDEYTRTLSARYYKDGSEALVYQGESLRPRRLTPRECARLQGFPKSFEAMFDRNEDVQPVSDTQAYKQFGNSVCVPIVESIAGPLVRYLMHPQRVRRLPDSPLPPQTDLFRDDAF